MSGEHPFCPQGGYFTLHFKHQHNHQTTENGNQKDNCLQPTDTQQRVAQHHRHADGVSAPLAMVRALISPLHGSCNTLSAPHTENLHTNHLHPGEEQWREVERHQADRRPGREQPLVEHLRRNSRHPLASRHLRDGEAPAPRHQLPPPRLFPRRNTLCCNAARGDRVHRSGRRRKVRLQAEADWRQHRQHLGDDAARRTLSRGLRHPHERHHADTHRQDAAEALALL